MELDAKNAFAQEDADYLPIPFARGLRMTWEGKLNELHFYHLQVRLYPPGAPVRTFDPQQDLKAFEPQLRAAAVRLRTGERVRGRTVEARRQSEPGQRSSRRPATGVRN
jgi:hypothetical protein